MLWRFMESRGRREIWIDRDPTNAEKVWEASVGFGAPLDSFGFSKSNLMALGTVIQIWIPPRRIDLLTEITGVQLGMLGRLE
jgi:hypothetical protein